MDIQRILQGVSRLTGLNQSRLDQAAQQAGQYRNVRTKDEALSTLRKIGIDNSFLNRVQNMLDSPIARTVAPLIGMNPRDASDAIEQLKTSESNSRFHGKDDRLAKFKHDLDRVKKYK